VARWKYPHRMALGYLLPSTRRTKNFRQKKVIL